jgi:hypothetical protein
MYVFPIILILQFVFLGLLLNIAIFIYLCILLYTIMSTELNCKRSEIILTIIMGVISTIFVVILIFTKTTLFF